MSLSEVRPHPVPPRSLNLFQNCSGNDAVDGPCSQYPQQPVGSCCSTPSPSAKALRSEALRLATYVGWPLSYISPQSMASAGFFYRGHADEVQCAFCLVRIGSWEPSDNPMGEHKRYMPGCPFVNELPVGNVPLSPNAVNIGLPLTATTQFPIPQIRNSASADICGRYVHEIRPNARAEQEFVQAANVQAEEPCVRRTVSSLNTSPASSGIIPHQKAKSPEFSTYASRIRSFTYWPVAIAQQPEELAEAGFYYLGVGDQVKCFSCDKGLRNWERQDIPWDEHARWSPECLYLLSMKGSDFVREVDARYNNPCEEEAKPAHCTETPKVEKKETGKPNEVEAMLCKICYEKPLCMVFLPCAHSMACASCSAAFDKCPVCRKRIEAKIRAYFG